MAQEPSSGLARRGLPGATALYGIAVFFAGFVFGALRELVLIPLAGERGGHWIEFPLMLAATAVVARLVTRSLGDATTLRLILLGAGGTILLLLIESAFALFVMSVPPEKYLAGFDVSRGALFPFGLLFMCIAPLLMFRTRAQET